MPPVGGGQISARPGWGWQQEGLYSDHSPCPSLWLSFFSRQREGKGVLSGAVSLRLVTTSLWSQGLAQHTPLPGVSRKGLRSQQEISFNANHPLLAVPQRMGKAQVRQKENKRKLRSPFRNSYYLRKGPCPRNDQNLPPSVAKLGKVGLLFKDEVSLCYRLDSNSDP